MLPAASISLSNLSTETVQQWLTQAQHLSLTDPTSQRGIRILEQLLSALIPKETALLDELSKPIQPRDMDTRISWQRQQM